MKQNVCSDLPRHLCKKLLIDAKRANVTKSPRLAAIGVAMLSGFRLHFLDKTTTITISEPKIKLATVAVTRLLAHNKVAWFMSKWPSTTQPIVTAAEAASVATTMA